MKKYNRHIYMIATLALLPVMVLAANTNLDDEVNAELDRMYQNTKAQNVQPAGAAVNVNVNQNQGQNQAQTQGMLQTQRMPVTNIEASPMVESRAEKIRRARQDAEIQTEQKIVEKLEQSRIDDERRRAEVLFGDKFNQINGNNNVIVEAPVVAAPVVAQAPVVVQAPVQAPVQTPVVVEPVPVQEVATTHAVVEEVHQHQNRTYFSALLGVSDYPEAKNLRGKFATGFAFGMLFEDQIAVEGSYTYGSYEVEQICSPYSGSGCGGATYPYGGYYGQGGYSPYNNPYTPGSYYPTITQMDQHQGALTAKYLLLRGYSFRPLLGASMAYTYRSFTDTQFARYNSDATSTALDVGFVMGAEIELSRSFSIGVDYKYFMNLTNQNSAKFQQSFVYPTEPNRKPVERMNYYTLGILGRMSF
jgi:hypothetical protein